MTTRWTSARGSLAGSSTGWPGGGPSDLQTADDVTDLIYSGSSQAFPQASVLSGRSFGVQGSISTFTNATFTNAGGQTSPSPEGFSPLLAGSITISSTTQIPEVGLDTAGEYDIWCALGSANSAQASKAYLFEGSSAKLASGVSGVSMAITLTSTSLDWATGQSVALNSFRITSDLAVWKKLTSGTQTTGSTEPDSTGLVLNDTFDDGGVIWTFTGRRALAKISGTQSSAAHIVDQNSNVAAASTWPTTPIRRTITSTFDLGYCFVRTDTPFYFRCCGEELVPPTLEDALVTNVWGQSQNTEATLYAMQPVGTDVLNLDVNTGLGTAAAFSLTGNLASYFEVVQDGGIARVRQTVPIPDDFADPELSIVQTSAGATGSPYTTELAVTLVSSQGRPFDDGSYWGKVRTENWLNHKRVKDVQAAELWKGLVGQGNPVFATDVAVTSDTAMRTAITNAIAAKTGTSWHRIRLQDGTYEGTASFVADFGTGGLLIEPDGGHDPQVNSRFYPFNVCGVHVRNLLMPGDKLATGGDTWMFRSTDVGGSGGVAGSGKLPMYVLENIRNGVTHIGVSDTDLATRANAFLMAERAHSVYIKGGDYAGLENGGAISLFGVRVWWIDGISTSHLMEDLFAWTGPTDLDASMGVFPDEIIYGEISGVICRADPDAADYYSLVHADFSQERTVGANTSVWKANCGSYTSNADPDGTPWVVGQKMYCRESNRWYEVASVTTGISGTVAPSGTGTGISDGGVTWDFLSENILATERVISFHDNYMLAARVLSEQGSYRQFHIASNEGFGSTTKMSVNNNVNMTLGDKGVAFAEGELYAENNTFANPPNWNANHVSLTTRFTFTSNLGKAMLLDNIVKGPVSNLGGASVYEKNNISLDWRSDGAGSGSPVGSYLQGSFIARPFNTGSEAVPAGPGYQYGYTLQNDGLNSREEFLREVRTVLKVINGTAGMWPRIFIQPGESVVLSQAQAQTLAAETANADLATGLGPTELRFNYGPSETGPVVGADLTFDVE